MIERLNNKWSIAAILATSLLLPTFVQAEGFINLVGIPGLDAASPNTGELVNTLLRIAIITALLVAVIKLILGGAQYILSGVVTEKADAKKDIRGAFIGLLIILTAVTVLTTINPAITNLPALQRPTLPELPPPYVPPDPLPVADTCASVTCGDDERQLVDGSPPVCLCVPRTPIDTPADDSLRCVNGGGHWFDIPSPGVCYFATAGAEVPILDPDYVNGDEATREFVCLGLRQRYEPAAGAGLKGTCVCQTLDGRCYPIGLIEDFVD